MREDQKSTSKPKSRALVLSEGSRGVTMFGEVFSSDKGKYVKRFKRHGSLATEVPRPTVSGSKDTEGWRAKFLFKHLRGQGTEGWRPQFLLSVVTFPQSFGNHWRAQERARHADRHPGMPGARMLQRMSDNWVEKGATTDWEVLDTPAAGSAYHLQVARVIYPNMSFRHERRMSSFAEAIDRLALNQPRRVADLLCQRYRALDMSIADAGWERAKHLELVRELVTSSNRKKRSLAKELRDEACAKSYPNAAQGIGKHRGTSFAKKGQDFPSEGVQAVCREKVKDFGRGCGVGPESEFDVAVLACHLWQRRGRARERRAGDRGGMFGTRWMVIYLRTSRACRGKSK